MWSLVREFVGFLRKEKKWWLVPLVLVLLLIGLVVVFGSSPVLAPLMYPFL